MPDTNPDTAALLERVRELCESGHKPYWQVADAALLPLLEAVVKAKAELVARGQKAHPECTDHACQYSICMINRALAAVDAALGASDG